MDDTSALSGVQPPGCPKDMGFSFRPSGTFRLLRFILKCFFVILHVLVMCLSDMLLSAHNFAKPSFANVNCLRSMNSFIHSLIHLFIPFIHSFIHSWKSVFFMKLFYCILISSIHMLFSVYIKLAMLLCVRDSLMSGDFASNMKLLQNFPEDIDIALVLKKADEVYQTLKP